MISFVVIPSSVTKYAVFFLIGCYFPSFINYICGASSVFRTVMVVSAFLVMAAVMSRQNWWYSIGTEFLLGLIGVIGGVMVSVSAARIDGVARLMSYIGMRTLPIYVMHTPILALTHAILSRSLEHQIWSISGFYALYPLVISAWLVVSALVVYEVLLRLGAKWLFTLPELTLVRGGQFKQVR